VLPVAADPAFLDLEQVGEVGLDNQGQGAGGRGLAEVAQHEVLAHAVTDVSVPEHQ